jgi:DNA primase
MIHAARNNDEKERIRDASDIVRVIGEHVALKAKGREYVCLCPFHDDHKPSMNVVPHKQIFHCFVCGAGGDVFSFIEKYHKMEFRESLEYLAERAGIALTPFRPAAAAGTADPAGAAPITRADLVRANASAADFFRAIYRHAEHGRTARQIVQRRGISPEMVELFGIGASPDRWDGLMITARSKGADPAVFAEAGLLKHRDDGGLYDAFRNRLMFPIQDQIGRVIAFGARKINEEDEPKYLNSPETRLFEKSGTLYGLFQASRAIQTERTAIITEGYTDTIACHQAGVTNAVATLGTALTPRHAAVLRRLCDTVVLLFDGDAAGQRAADRAVEVFFSEEIDVKIATLAGITDAKDPDELLKRDGGVEVLRRAVASAVDVLDYRYARIKDRLRGAGMAALNRAVEEDLLRLVDLGFNRVALRRRMLIVKKIADITGLTEKVIADSIPGGRRGPMIGGAAATSPRIARASGVAGLSTLEQALGCLLCEPSLWLTISDAQRELLDPAHLPEGPARDVAEAMGDLAAAGSPPSFQAVCSHFEGGESAATATDLYVRIEDVTGKNPDLVRTYFGDCVRRLAEQDDRPRSLEFARERAAAIGANRRVLPRPRTG